MKVYFVEQTLAFPDVECRGDYRRVSDYYRNREDAIKYMKDNYSPSQYEGSWSTIHIAEEELDIH